LAQPVGARPGNLGIESCGGLILEPTTGSPFHEECVGMPDADPPRRRKAVVRDDPPDNHTARAMTPPTTIGSVIEKIAAFLALSVILLVLFPGEEIG